MLSFLVMIVWVAVGVTAAWWVQDRIEPWHRLRVMTMLGTMLGVCIIVSEVAVYSATG